MLQPGTGAWHVHYDALPYAAYAPLPIAPLKGLAKRGSGPQGLLGRACMTKLRRGVTAYQARVKAGTVEVDLLSMKFRLKHADVVYDISFRTGYLQCQGRHGAGDFHPGARIPSMIFLC